MKDKTKIIKCESEKTLGYNWNMMHSFYRTIYTECTYKAKWEVKMKHKKTGKIITKVVCGIHRNSIKKHCSEVGIEYSEKPLNNV